jgi:hypothetical protein
VTRGLPAAFAALAPPGAREGRLARGLRLAALRVLVPVLVRRHHLADLLALLDGAPAPRPAATAPGPAARASSADARRVVDALRGRRMTCLHRALAGYAALRRRGEDVRFVIGVRRDGDGRDVVAHAWLERDGAPFGEPEEPRTRWAVAFVHPPPAEKERCLASTTPRADVILTELQDGTGVLLHLGTKFYYALNATGVAAWKLLEAGTATTPDAIAQRLVTQFEGVTLEAARRDVEALLAELRAEDLLPRAGGGP